MYTENYTNLVGFLLEERVSKINMNILNILYIVLFI